LLRSVPAGTVGATVRGISREMELVSTIKETFQLFLSGSSTITQAPASLRLTEISCPPLQAKLGTVSFGVLKAASMATVEIPSLRAISGCWMIFIGNGMVNNELNAAGVRGPEWDWKRSRTDKPVAFFVDVC